MTDKTFNSDIQLYSDLDREEKKITRLQNAALTYQNELKVNEGLFVIACYRGDWSHEMPTKRHLDDEFLASLDLSQFEDTDEDPPTFADAWEVIRDAARGGSQKAQDLIRRTGKAYAYMNTDKLKYLNN